MKTQIINLVSGAVLLISLSACQPAHNPHSVVPADWEVNSENDPVSNPQLDKTVDQDLDANSEALEKVEAPSGRWQLSGMIFELAVSVEGVMGVLMGEGEAAVKTMWLRSDSANAESKAEKNTTATDKKYSFSLHTMDSLDTLRKHADLLSEMAIVTGKVKNPQALRSNLMNKFQEFAQMGRLLNYNEIAKNGWKLSEFRQILLITAEGDVAAGIAVGGLLEFELHWKVESEESDAAENLYSPIFRRRPSLESLLNGIVADLNAVKDESASEFEVKGFELEGFYIELGVKGETDFGIANSSTAAIGKLVFEKADRDDPDATIHVGAGSDDDSTVNIVSSRETRRANRSVFRHGLRRAMKMGSFFARHASSVKGKKWYIKEIEPEFELAVNGTVGIATIEGAAALALEFERKHQP